VATRTGREAAGKTTTKETKDDGRRTHMSKVMDKETKGNGRGTEMNNVMNMVDSCMKTQKDFMDGYAKAQKEGLERWAEATMKLQKPFLNMAGTQEGPMKDVLGFYNNGLTTMMNSARTVADESAKIQESWKSAVEKQMEMAREMTRQMTAFFQPIGAQK
jgi:hypothetical protein